MSEVVEVECPNEECPGRREDHALSCVCQGTAEVPVAGPVQVDEVTEDGTGLKVIGRVSTAPCPEEPFDLDVERWDATWHPATREQPGEWGPDISCPRCGEEGVAVE